MTTECPYEHLDCFALRPNDHRCGALVDTTFKPGRDCPFYKPEDKVKPKYRAKNRAKSVKKEETGNE